MVLSYSVTTLDLLKISAFFSRTNINQDDGDDENDENDESSRDELDKSANIKIKHSKREAVYRDFQKETKVRAHSRFEFKVWN